MATRLEQWAERVTREMHEAGWLNGGEDGDKRARAVLENETRKLLTEEFHIHDSWIDEEIQT